MNSKSEMKRIAVQKPDALIDEILRLQKKLYIALTAIKDECYCYDEKSEEVVCVYCKIIKKIADV